MYKRQTINSGGVGVDNTVGWVDAQSGTINGPAIRYFTGILSFPTFRKVRFTRTSTSGAADDRFFIDELQVWVDGENIARENGASAFTTVPHGVAPVTRINNKTVTGTTIFESHPSLAAIGDNFGIDLNTDVSTHDLESIVLYLSLIHI